MADNCLQTDVNKGKIVPKRMSLRGRMSKCIRELHRKADNMARSGCADRAKAGNEFLDIIEPFLEELSQ